MDWRLWLRSRADLNRCTRFCRPLPNHSATGPFSMGANLTNFLVSYQHLTGKLNQEFSIFGSGDLRFIVKIISQINYANQLNITYNRWMKFG